MARFLAAALALAALALSLVLAPGASAQVQPYGTNDNGYFNNVLPPGQNGFDNALALAQYEANKTVPAAQQRPAADVLEPDDCGAATSRESQLDDFYKDATFGVQAGDVGEQREPRARGHDRPRQELRCAAHLRRHARRADVRDRLRDRRGPPVLHRRPAPRRRGHLAQFAGGGNVSMDESVWASEPYTAPGPAEPDRRASQASPAGRRSRGHHRLRRGDQRVHQQGAEPDQRAT